ncbi:NAD(P)-binding domain-containing protein [Martelella limonii]|uniref:NAD(P)-binding domain-containing protein n=1 Tax=Martelella limonii TaxID=1647649 RepID=UPI00158076D2|nr:NAD(P)/FAD-dependent oxidoreductase [Martelella limonii]
MPTSLKKSDAPLEGRDGLAALNERVRADLAVLKLPPAEWTARATTGDGASFYDVIIVGAGMFGLSAAGSLMFKGIRNIKLLDRASAGKEGPWVTFARMLTLRSKKDLPGSPFGIPSLTFRSWYVAAFGEAAWETLYKIPNAVWQDYLIWIRNVLELPVDNDCDVVGIAPYADHVALTTADGRVIRAKRIVIATGRPGAGGFNLPAGVSEDLWPDLAAHTSEMIDFGRLKGKSVAVIGAGSSAWDNAATALETGAGRVEMFCRRKALPQLNKGRANANPGFFAGWRGLSDAKRWEMAVYLERVQTPPPHETVLRTIAHDNFEVHFGKPFKTIARNGAKVEIAFTDGESRQFDFLILGTGFAVDLGREPMFSALKDRILTWGDCYQPPEGMANAGLAQMPYLGEGFELKERGVEHSAVSRIHIFNTGSYLSFGTLSLDVPSVNPAGEHLASHIASHLFVDDFDVLFKRLKDWEEEHELEPTPFYAPDYVNRA